MAIQAPIRMSAADFDEFVKRPENADKLLELIGGKVVEVVSNPFSSNIGARMATFIGMYLLEHDLGYLTGADGGYMVSGERYIPDVGFIRYEKQPELAYDQGYNPNPPDLAVEVLSPGNTDEEIAVKIANYLAAGAVVWRINPPEEQVAVFAPGQPVKFLTINDTLDGGDVLPDFKLAVRDLFSRRKD